MDKIAKSIIKGLNEALAAEQGKPVAMRHHAVVPEDVDVKAIRHRLHMSQRQFAACFGFAIGTVQNWERGHRRPEGAARAFLKVIAKRPEAVIEALAS